MNQSILDFIGNKNITVAGVSRSGKKFGNAAVKELTARGYTIHVVHPEAEQVDGYPCTSSLHLVQDKSAGLLVVVPPKNALFVLQDAATIGIKNVWLQKGAESPEVIALAESLHLNYVAGKCILMYAEPVNSVHKFHRNIMKFFGKL